MALPSSGSISLGQVNTELGVSATATRSLGETTTRNLFGVGSGAISMSQGYGKANQFAFTISSSVSNANLRTLAVNAGWNQSSKVVATINTGVYVYANATNQVGLTIDGSFPGGVELVNNGYILGQGGNGGGGGGTWDAGSSCGLGSGGSGGAGGKALHVATGVTIYNNGTIGGGGGGGGGGLPIDSSKQSADIGKGITGLGKLNEALFGVTFALSSLTPTIDENSTAFEKGLAKTIESATYLSSVLMGVSALMTAFGFDLAKMKLSNLLPSNLGKSVGSMAWQAGLSTGAAKLAGAFAKASASVAAGAIVFYGIKKAGEFLIDSFYLYSDRLKKAIETGNIEGARNVATEQAATKQTVNLTAGVAGGAVTGALVAGPLGAAVGGILGGFAAFVATDLPEYAGAVAASQAAQVKVQKELTLATDKAAKAMKEFENGNISATDVLKSTSGVTAAVEQSRKEAAKLETQAIQNRPDTATLAYGGAATGATIGARIGSIAGPLGSVIGGGIGSVVGGAAGYFYGSSQNAKMDKQVAEANKQASEKETEALKSATPGLELLQRSIAVAGGTFQDFLDQVENTDENLYKIIQRAGTNDLAKGFENIRKEAERTRKAFEAMNLGFQNISASSSALSVNLDNYLASQEAGFVQTENTIRTLEASVTEAAQGIRDNDFSAALSDASKSLRELGSSDTQIKKFEENLTAINTAQKFFASASEETKNRLKAEFERGVVGKRSLEEKRTVFGDVINEQLKKEKIGEDIRERIRDALAKSNLSETDMKEIIGENFSVLNNILKDLGQTTLKEVIPALKEKTRYEKELIDLTKKRIESENKIIEAQRGVLEAQLEAQDIIAKYGGKELTPEIKRQNIVAQANVQASGVKGISQLTTGSAPELQQRSAQIRARLAQIDQKRAFAAASGKPVIAGEEGKALEGERQRLLELAKSDYDTTKKLIALKEEEIKVIGEKNKLEKDSINSLISGDIESFFEAQDTLGAQAAIATGNKELQAAYGPDALGRAAKENQRLQEAGVTSLYGQQLGGAGGLTERGFGAALGSRGVMDPRLAQIAAGTTAEEEVKRSEIRDLAGTLPNNAEIQLQSAQADQAAADLQYKAAEMQLQAATEQVRARGGEAMAGVGPAQGRAHGGLIYANRGIFVPRGTDTVPAMLTPGEFVVNRAAVQRGNNLQILQAMNRGSNNTLPSVSTTTGDANATGMSRGGVVRYRANGSTGPESSGGGINMDQLTNALNSFNAEFSKNIDKLQNTNLSVKLDATNINVNLTDGGILQKLTSDLKSEIMKEVANKLSSTGMGQDGRLKERSTVTNT